MKYSCVLLLLYSFTSLSQQVFEFSDTVNKKRVNLTTVSYTAIASSSVFALNQIWYKDYPKTKMHSFDDSKNWLQMDKFGHVYTAYQLNAVIASSYKWSGLTRKKSALLGTAYAWSYQFAVELMDGQSAGWGFSWSDLAANSIGCGMFLGQELAWNEQKIQFKFGYYPSSYAQYRPNVLGSTFSEKILKDYNAQRYWFCFSLSEAFQLKQFPKWLNLAVGYSVSEKLVGDQDVYTLTDGSKTFNARREFLLSLDINVKRLPIKRKWVKALISPIHMIKIPFTTLVISKQKMEGKFIY